MKEIDIITNYIMDELKSINIFFLIGLVCIISSPFTLIWIGWSIFLKLFLSGIVYMIILMIIYFYIKYTVRRLVKEYFDNPNINTEFNKLVYKLIIKLEQESIIEDEKEKK